MELGGNYLANGKTRFTVWGPHLDALSLKILPPADTVIPMVKDRRGYWHLTVEGLSPETRYCYRIDDKIERADPASHYQPSGVSGCSQLVDHKAFRWNDDRWRGPSLSELIIYELHVGTFTPEGTFSSIIRRLDELRETGFNAIELMPVAQFPGERNWGYDGVYPFAVQNSYGGPRGLKTLVDECHQRDIAVILDVVYNHFGPEGCYVDEFGPYTTAKYTTPWGNALNFDDAFNYGVRNFFIENTRHWLLHYHIDVLRLDAVHSIKDLSAYPFLKELADQVAALRDEVKRNVYLIAESDLNNSSIIRSRDLGGYALDAQWADDFHHCVHALLTGEQRGYYADFGRIGQLAKALNEAFVYTGQYSDYRKSNYGNSTEGLTGKQFVVYCQNHDQVGNRMRGERLSSLVSFEGLKVAAATVMLSPFIPLVFMGEEYGEEAPFLYFVNHADPSLLQAVSQGRKEEFRDFQWAGEFPEPHAPGTFACSRIDWDKRRAGVHKILLAFYRRLIGLRREVSALGSLDTRRLKTWPVERDRLLLMHRWDTESAVFCVFNYHSKRIIENIALPDGQWELLLDSSVDIWGGPGQDAQHQFDQPVSAHPLSVKVFKRI